MTNRPEAVCVNPKLVGDVWNNVRHFIQAAMRRGGLGSFSEVERDVLCGGALLWVAWERHASVIEAAAVTQVTQTDGGKICTLVACGGSQRDRWLGLLANIEAYAKSQGCRSMCIMGRMGWRRVLKNYSTTKVILERLL